MDMKKYKKSPLTRFTVDLVIEDKENLEAICKKFNFKGRRETIEFLLDFYNKHKEEMKDDE